MKTSAILYRAARLIRNNGWRRSLGFEPSGPHCMVSAAATAAHFDYWNHSVVETPWYEAMNRVTDSPVGFFNDVECECADDATAALEIAADIASAEGR